MKPEEMGGLDIFFHNVNDIEKPAVNNLKTLPKNSVTVTKNSEGNTVVSLKLVIVEYPEVNVTVLSEGTAICI